MSFAKSLKDYFENVWPEIISICCSIIIFLFSSSKPNILWAIFIIISPFIVVFFIRYFLLKGKTFLNEKPDHLMVCSIKKLRDFENEFPQDNADGDRFAQTIVDVCDSVCQTIIGDGKEIDKCRDYSVVVYLGVKTDSGKIEDFSPLYSDNSKMSESYMMIYGAKILSLKDNTSFNEVHNAYCVKTPHTPKIKTVSNVKKKIRKGLFHSTFLRDGVGIKEFPYNSSCVFPILPFHNGRKGDEMQGYVSIMSNRRYAFKDSGINNRDFSHYLEIVSGILYNICIKDKSKDQPAQ